MPRHVVAIFPEDVSESVQAYRCAWDPLHSRLRPHVTLVFPSEIEVPEDELHRAVAECVAGFPPFAMDGDRVVPWEEEYLFLLVDRGAEDVRRLHTALYEGAFSSAPRPEAFVPHMTVGRTDGAQMEKALAEAIDLRLDCTAASVTVYRVEEDGARTQTLCLPFRDH